MKQRRSALEGIRQQFHYVSNSNNEDNLSRGKKMRQTFQLIEGNGPHKLSANPVPKNFGLIESEKNRIRFRPKVGQRRSSNEGQQRSSLQLISSADLLYIYDHLKKDFSLRRKSLLLSNKSSVNVISPLLRFHALLEKLDSCLIY